MTEGTVVIVGVDIRDAQSVAMSRREHDRGKRVILVSLGDARGAQRVQGLRVMEFEFSSRSFDHPNFAQIYDELHRSELMTNYQNGDK